MDSDRNLLFGVLALQADLIDEEKFVEACTAWAARKATPLADLLLQRGWITPADKELVAQLMERKLRKHAGDASKSLAAVSDGTVQRALADVADPEIRHTLSAMREHEGHVLLSTIAYQPETRERYTLTRLHAKGGIGQVWLARDGDLGREVALKELRPEQADNVAVWARFMEEARITGQLEHPGIVPVYELVKGSADKKSFYTMRFVRGCTLTEAIKALHQKRRAHQEKPLDLIALLNAFVGVC